MSKNANVTVTHKVTKARRILTATGREDLPHNHFIDRRRIQLSLFDERGDHLCADRWRRNRT